MAKQKRKATSAVGIAPRWKWTVEARDVFGRFLFVLSGAWDRQDEAELEAARVRAACHDSGRIRFAVVARDVTTPECQRVRSLDDNRNVGKTSGAKGARKSIPTAATKGSNRPSRAVRIVEEEAPPPAPKKPIPGKAKGKPAHKKR
jgi:hypothetical protein